MARVAFLQNVFEDQLGTLWISALLKERGHQSEVFIVSPKRGLPDELLWYEPDAVGFSCTTGNTPFALETARKIKSLSKALIVLGGPHPTHMPEIIEEDPVDVVCVGEGEYAMVELADAVDRNGDLGHIRNLWVKIGGEVHRNEVRPLVADLDSLPFPDRSYYRRYPLLKDKTAKFFICSRGCPFNCSFCANPALKKIYRSKGKFLRLRSPANVVEEIKQAGAASTLSYCQFVDELLISDKKWLFDFLKLYREEIGLPFSCTIQAHLVDEETIKELKASGCDLVSYGIETGNKTLREVVLRKKVSDREIIETASMLKKHRIRFKVFNMFGIPGETVDNALETLRLNRRVKADFVYAALVQFFPGTEITEYAMKKGMIDKEYASRAQITSFKASICNMPHIKEIVRVQKLFDVLVKLPVPEALIKCMIKLPLDFFYELIFILSYGIMVMRSTRKRFVNTFIIGLRLLRLYRSH